MFILFQSSLNEDKKLKRNKKKDKKNKKSNDNKNKQSENKQMLMKPLSILSEISSEWIKPNKGQTPSLPANASELNDDSEDEEAGKTTDPSEIQMLDSLTGVPHVEDELLFAVPVVAPYSALTNYK